MKASKSKPAHSPSNMKLMFYILFQLALCSMLYSQNIIDEARITALLSGKKGDDDQEVIASLGIDSIDVFVDRLLKEREQNKLPIYASLIGIKYRQFSDGLTPNKQTKILTALSAKIREIKDEAQSAYLIQSSLNHLQGINHPVVRQLIDVYLRSDVEWTKNAAQSLKDSLTKTPTATKNTPIQPPVTAPQESATPSKSKVTEAKPSALSGERTVSTSWSVVTVLIVAAITLAWLVLKSRK